MALPDNDDNDVIDDDEMALHQIQITKYVFASAKRISTRDSVSGKLHWFEKLDKVENEVNKQTNTLLFTSSR